jgi:hypothetical protein
VVKPFFPYFTHQPVFVPVQNQQVVQASSLSVQAGTPVPPQGKGAETDSRQLTAMNKILPERPGKICSQVRIPGINTGCKVLISFGNNPGKAEATR